MKFRILPVLLVVGSLCAFAGTTWAAPPARSAAPAHPQSLEQAVKQVQHQTRGHILAADTVSRGRTQVYRIKVLTPRGKVQVVQLHSSPPASSRSSKSQSDQGGH